VRPIRLARSGIPNAARARRVWRLDDGPSDRRASAPESTRARRAPRSSRLAPPISVARVFGFAAPPTRISPFHTNRLARRMPIGRWSNEAAGRDRSTARLRAPVSPHHVAPVACETRPPVVTGVYKDPERGILIREAPGGNAWRAAGHCDPGQVGGGPTDAREPSHRGAANLVHQEAP
jgi:hypothetical protein